MTMKDRRQFKDPNSLAVPEPGASELNRVGHWWSADRIEMDAQFRLAMSTAIEAGLEHCATEPSTHFGTRAPITNYQRD
jgi:hypothetical protein